MRFAIAGARAGAASERILQPHRLALGLEVGQELAHLRLHARGFVAEEGAHVILQLLRRRQAEPLRVTRDLGLLKAGKDDEVKLLPRPNSV